jgi:hypothetical protein
MKFDVTQRECVLFGDLYCTGLHYLITSLPVITLLLWNQTLVWINCESAVAQFLFGRLEMLICLLYNKSL